MNITYPSAIPNAWPDVLHVDAYPKFSLQAQKKIINNTIFKSAIILFGSNYLVSGEVYIMYS